MAAAPLGLDRATLDALMIVALDEARAAIEHGDVPIGAVIARVSDGAIVARRHNERERLADPTAHAELLAIRDAAAAVGASRLDGHVLVTTLEPCPMCAGATVLARLDAVAFGAADPKGGALGSLYHLGSDPRLNHEVAVVDGVQGAACAELLRGFFADRR
ncbi:MAG: nucleoside deaminase [Acidimicrobiia bacterium]|jgi:tRNA(adenine34) deaminase